MTSTHRIIKQPGPPAKPRILSVAGRSGGELRIVLPEGADLLNGLVRALGDAGVASAAVTLVGGSFKRMQYLTGQPGKGGKKVAIYGAPTVLEGPVTLLSGNAFLGVDEAGQPIMHCHAVMTDRAGKVHGGHLPPGVCEAGRGGILVHAAVLADLGLAVRYDAETDYPVFHPTALAKPAAVRTGARTAA